jgi:hypothetical protein
MVIGTPPGETDRRTVTVPSGTLLSIDLSFSSATPNGCPNPALQGGFYAIGSGTNIASISLLGYRYPATGGIEVGNQGPCGSNGVFSGLRLFVSGSGVPIAPGGTLVHWPPASSFGNMFINGPAAPAPGLLPILLPSNPFPIGTGGTITPFATNVQLVIESGQISTKPEPLADVWLGGAVFGALVTRRLARRRKAH